MDLIVRNARLVGRLDDGLLDIAVENGRIAAIGRALAAGGESYDAAGPLVCAGLKQGAPVLGAAPRYDSDPSAQIDRIFALAREYDVDLDLHLDVGDNPAHMDVYRVLELTEQYRRGGRVVVGHMAKLSLLPPAELAALAGR